MDIDTTSGMGDFSSLHIIDMVAKVLCRLKHRRLGKDVCLCIIGKVFDHIFPIITIFSNAEVTV